MKFKELKNIVGDDDYFDDEAHLNAYCYDATRERYKPDCVVFPQDESEVSKILKFCNDNKIAVTPRGAGSGFTGGALPKNGGVICKRQSKRRDYSTRQTLQVRVTAP